MKAHDGKPRSWASRLRRTSAAIVFCIAATSAAAQSTPNALPSEDAQRCAALTEMSLETVAGAPAVVISAQLMDVPLSGLDRPIYNPSGYGRVAPRRQPTNIREYCDVTGYVAPQNKFELKLPLVKDWNQKFFFLACGGFCGAVDGDRCNLGVERGYDSVTGNEGTPKS